MEAMGRREIPDQEAFPHWCEKCDLTFLSARDLELHLQGSHHKLSDWDKRFLKALKITPWMEE